MNTCRVCNHPVAPSAEFCPNCGSRYANPMMVWINVIAPLAGALIAVVVILAILR